MDRAGLRQNFIDNDSQQRTQVDDDSDDEAFDTNTGYGGVIPAGRREKGRAAFEKVPCEVGRKLMQCGHFGVHAVDRDSRSWKKKLAYKTMTRELGLGAVGYRKLHNNIVAQVRSQDPVS